MTCKTSSFVLVATELEYSVKLIEIVKQIGESFMLMSLILEPGTEGATGPISHCNKVSSPKIPTPLKKGLFGLSTTSLRRKWDRDRIELCSPLKAGRTVKNCPTFADNCYRVMTFYQKKMTRQCDPS